MATQNFRFTVFILFCLLAPCSQADQSDRENERQTLLEKIEKLNGSICEDPSKLCKKFISNNETSDAGIEYREKVLAKIRTVAESSYPKKLKDDGRYGAVILSFEIGRDGDLRKASLLKKSNIDLIDEFALDLIRLSAPFPTHKGVFSERTDIVVITDVMHFNILNKDKMLKRATNKAKHCREHGRVLRARVRGVRRLMNLKQAFEMMNDTCDWSHIDIITDVNQRNTAGDTPLHVAACWGDIEIMELFLDSGADINAIGEDDCTPLHSSVISGNIEAVRYLLSLYPAWY